MRSEETRTMKLRTKSILFFGTFLLAIAISIFFYAEYVVGNVFKKQAVNNLRIIAEQSESAYLSFLGSLKVRALDWTSDNTIRETTKEILNTKEGTPERELSAKKFGEYVSSKKMPFDKTIIVADLLDKNGIVIASTRANRIGQNEKAEELENSKVHNFDATINSKFGEVFFGTIVIDGDQHPDPTLNVTARIFDIDKKGGVRPLDAVLLVYYSNVMEVSEVLGSGTSVYAGLPATTERKTTRALLNIYETSDLYLVNSGKYLVTPSRTIKDVRVKQKVDTLPVRECLEKGNEVSEEYDNYQGVRVLGASMCFQREGIVVLVEIQKDEIFAPLTTLIKLTALLGVAAIAIGIIIIIMFIRRPLARIDNVVKVAKKVAKGNLNARVAMQTNDELGYLAAAFNTMIIAVRFAQKELQLSRNKIEEEKVKAEALIASLGEGLIATDKIGNIVLINPVAEKMLGLNSEDVIWKNITEVIVAFDEDGNEIPREKRTMNAGPEGSTTTSTEMIYEKKDGGRIPVAVTTTPIILNDKIIGSIEVFRDITKEKEIEKTRTDLLSLASHQLRTPLSGTKWLIETLKRGIHGSLTEEQTKYLDEIYKINERMTTLVHDMLGVLRMEGDHSPAKNEGVSTREVLTEALETVRAAAQNKRITIEVDPFTDRTINTDRIILQNILESLVSNAINYSEPNRTVIISVEQKDRESVFAIKDHGIGIPHDEQDRLFERFYRASNAKTFDTRGSGLGLYIAATLAKKINAKLSFVSEKDKGSTFWVHVPISQNGNLPQNVARVYN